MPASTKRPAKASPKRQPPARPEPPPQVGQAAEPHLLAGKFILNARPDTLDFRDKMYEPTLVEVPPIRPLADYLKVKVPVLNQGTEGACTGFGLATVANYLLRARRHARSTIAVCPRMLYEMARRYDEWPGEDYSGSSARGAMKGWFNHGVCAESFYPYVPNQPADPDKLLNPTLLKDALMRPLGAYYRVNHQDLVAMHSAIAEVGILYATAAVHRGWEPRNVKKNGIIEPSEAILGGHAFAIVAYDERGFWIQNSWGEDWGQGGLGLLSYDDWLRHGTDVWVARLGAPINLRERGAITLSRTATVGNERFYAQATLRPHIISLGNDGALSPDGPFATTPALVRDIFQNSFADITATWRRKRLLLYAHGGLVSESAAIQRTADYLAPLLESEVYPLSFIWKTDYWTTLTNILKDAVTRRRPEGVIDASLDFMLDRFDDALEPVARALTGKAEWDEMKENALLASHAPQGGAALALGEIANILKQDGSVQLHLASHSAGSIFLAPLVQLITTAGEIKAGPLAGQRGLGRPIKSCTLWAPACTMDLFEQCYLPAIESGQIEHFALFTLNDQAEQDDQCANIYHKSLLYLVSNAFEARARVPWLRDGWPILGMEKFIRANPKMMALIESKQVDWILAPNNEAMGSPNQSKASSHGNFDDDPATVQATLQRILGNGAPGLAFSFKHSANALRDRRTAALR